MSDAKEELLKLCDQLQLSARINGKNGAVYLYEDLGEYECAEQAVLFLKQLIKNAEEND